jgi:hypothetical protein
MKVASLTAAEVRVIGQSILDAMGFGRGDGRESPAAVQFRMGMIALMCVQVGFTTWE